MIPFYEADRVILYLGDCIEVMRALPDASVDACVTDPPYELGFMGKGWDATGIANSVPMWSEALRVLKPGGHLAAFGGTRTYHRMACAVEDAGFEIRDTLAWMYGSGFPKSLDVSKAIDKAAGAEREITREGTVQRDGYGDDWDTGSSDTRPRYDKPATDAARQWEGWGTALKPAYEPIVLARKPLAGTVAANVLAHGTGAINVDGCRIGTEERVNVSGSLGANGIYGSMARNDSQTIASGRWPANVLLDEEAAAMLDAEVGDLTSGYFSGHRTQPKTLNAYGAFDLQDESPSRPANTGGPSRFFYTAKASRSEREAGLESVEALRRADAESRDPDAPGSNNPRLRVNARRNDHPTVKPVDLMAWLCRLVTQPGGLILDPFNGSGTTGLGALDGGFSYVGIEREPRYIEIARHRITHRHVLEAVTVEASAEVPMGRLL